MTSSDSNVDKATADAIAPDAVPWARQSSASVSRATTRTRRVVDNLPDWDPLPPGEILVHRHRQA